MNKTETKQRCKEIVREASRKEGLVKTSIVMELLPELLDGITIDKNFILNAIGDELNKPTANPLNLILKLFGLRIIRTQNTLQNIDGSMESVSSYSIEESSSVDTSNLIYLNEDLFMKASENIAKRLSEFEKESNETTQFLKDQNATLHGQIEKREAEFAQISSDNDGNIKSVADRVQYILSMLGQDASNNLFKQINELLEDLELHAVWYTEDVPESLFTMFKCADLDKHKDKPCIMLGDRVISKGVVFKVDEADKASAEQNN